MSAACRIRLATALTAATGMTITDVRHSIGSTFSLGLGRTRPRRYQPRRNGARRPGYHASADVDLFFFAALWTLREGGGYLLEDRSYARRIAGELERLKGRKVLFAKLVGYREKLELRLSGGALLTVLPFWDEDDPGWSLWFRDGVFWLNGYEKVRERPMVAR